MRGLIFGQLRQVEEDRFGRTEDYGLRQRRGSRSAGRQVVGFPILTHGLDAARVGIGNRDEPQRNGPAVMGERHHIGRVERQP